MTYRNAGSAAGPHSDQIHEGSNGLGNQLVLTLQDCIDLCQLTEGEVDAIAEHEHLPEIVAVELGNYLVHAAEGQRLIRRMIVDDIENARAHGNFRRMSLLIGVLRHFIETHPASVKADT